MSYTSEEIRDYLDRAGWTRPGNPNVLKKRNRLLVRCKGRGGEPILIKTWFRPRLQSALRRVTRSGSGDHEWRNLRRLHARGVAVPRPLGFDRIPVLGGEREVVAMRDLGRCDTATDRIQKLLRTGQERRLRAFEDALIDLSAALIRVGIVDPDHCLLNVLVPASGAPVRIDLELGRWVLAPNLAVLGYGAMLGRLIGTYAFAVQPEVERASAFAARLVQRLEPPGYVLRRAGLKVRRLLEEQQRRMGIETRVMLPWEAKPTHAASRPLIVLDRPLPPEPELEAPGLPVAGSSAAPTAEEPARTPNSGPERRAA